MTLKRCTTVYNEYAEVLAKYQDKLVQVKVGQPFFVGQQECTVDKVIHLNDDEMDIHVRTET